MNRSAREARARALPLAFGFREGTTSVHTSRTMMLDELSLLLENVGPNGKADEYIRPSLTETSWASRRRRPGKRTAKRLAELYSLDPARPAVPASAALLAGRSPGRPMLAFLAAAARDPFLRETTPFVVAIPVGAAVTPDADRDSTCTRNTRSGSGPRTALATAQRLASSWTQAGYLTGKVNKKRTRPVVTPVVVTFALLLGYLCGLRGKMLLDTVWTRMLDRTPAEIADLAAEASRQGWMNYKAAGSVVEITFPGLLTPQEEKASNEPD